MEDEVKKSISKSIKLIDFYKYNVHWEIRDNQYTGAMLYSRESRMVYIDVDEVRYLHETLDFYDLDDFILMMLAHEIGHHLHWESKEKELNSMILEVLSDRNHKTEKRWCIYTEDGAWKYGRLLIPERLKEKFDDFNEINLAQYRDVNEYYELKSSTRKKYESK